MGLDKGNANKVLSQVFIDNHSDLNEDQVASYIVESALKIKLLEDERSNDDKLNAAKQITKDMNAGYSSAIKYERAKIAFLLERIEEIQSTPLSSSGN